ncbi:MBOAT family O-acyltransferase [Helicobacter sp. MIT 00-7814]|uniref:MBOAT family O-acyltransferase n=1 Tax=unclassified Helicobacter TaxID=2593540 RepID=UPI0038D189FF
MPLPHIVLPLAISFFTFQQIAYLVDCYKSPKQYSSHLSASEFLDYCLFVTFFPQLIAGPIVHHKEMMPQFKRLNSACTQPLRELGILESNLKTEMRDSANLNQSREAPTLRSVVGGLGVARGSEKHDFERERAIQAPLSPCKESSSSNVDSAKNTCDTTSKKSELAESTQTKNNAFYESIAKGLFIFSIGLFKKVVIADSFAVWANAGFGAVESGAVLNLFESWATSLSYTFQLYFDFSGYCDMAIGLGLLFGITLPLNFNSPYKARNIADFWRRWHMTLGRFLKEYVYIPLGGNRNEKYKNALHYVLINKILTLRNLFIVAFLSGVWHGAGWGFVIWGCLHGVAMVIHRIYQNSVTNSASSMQCDKIYDFSEGTDAKSANLPKNHKNLHSHTANLGIYEVKTKSNINAKSVVRHCEDLQNPKQSTSNMESAQIDCFANKSARKTSEASFFSNDNLQQSTYKAKTPLKQKLLTLFYWLLTFNFVNLSWIFFRAENISGALNLIKGMFGGTIILPSFLESRLGFLEKYGVGFGNPIANLDEKMLLVLSFLIFGFLITLFLRNADELVSKLNNKKMIFAGLLCAMSIWQLGVLGYTPEFLYFNF